MKLLLPLCVLLLYLNTACNKKAPIDCSLVDCFSGIIIKVKFIDKNTGRDLVFGDQAKYSLNDLKIINSVYPGQVPVQIDSTDRSNPSIVLVLSVYSLGDVSLQLGDLPKDIMTIEAKTNQKEDECCPSTELINIIVNDHICKSCKDLSIITISK